MAALGTARGASRTRTVRATPIGRALALTALLACCGAAGLSAQPLPPAPETISLLGGPLFAPVLPDSIRSRYERRLAEAQNDFDH